MQVSIEELTVEQLLDAIESEAVAGIARAKVISLPHSSCLA